MKTISSIAAASLGALLLAGSLARPAVLSAQTDLDAFMPGWSAIRDRTRSRASGSSSAMRVRIGEGATIMSFLDGGMGRMDDQTCSDSKRKCDLR